jgi:hypothetical protein
LKSIFNLKPKAAHIILICFLFGSLDSIGQKDSSKKLTVSGYAELYYSYDFSKPINFEKPDYNYNYKKHNQLNINLAYVKASYQTNRFRSNLAIMAGNYATYNLSNEPNWARPIFEANVGYKIFRQHNLWVDAGIMPSHLGFESAVGGDCWTLTRSILAENSPYFETGVRVSYSNKKENVLVAFYVLNGWQKIALSKFDTKPSFGIQVSYKPNNTITVNYSNFIGSAKPDSLQAFRIFHNLYAIYDVSPKISFIVGLDVGTEKRIGNKLAVWYTHVFISRINLHRKHRVAGRLEFYNDPKQAVIQTGTANGYQTWGASANYDYQITPKLLFRAEVKTYQSKDAIFKYEQPSRISNTATVAMVVRL